MKLKTLFKKHKSVFLAGTIDNGTSENWQQQVIDELGRLGLGEKIVVFNPRRDYWNPNSDTEALEKQILWEQEHLDKADLIVMIFKGNSKSPITLLELGLYAKSKKLVVFCTDSFYRYTNVKLTCKKYHIPLVKTTYPKYIAEEIQKRLC